MGGQGKNEPNIRQSRVRVIQYLRECRRTGDWFGLGLAALVAVIAAWLAALPFSPAVQRATIDRFHLVTPSFAAWALQQPSPPMYNLENRYWFARRELKPAELVDNPAEGIETGMLNHFPTRIITFFDSRIRLFLNENEGWLYVRSRYQDQQRVTVYHVHPRDEGRTLLMERVEGK